MIGRVHRNRNLEIVLCKSGLNPRRSSPFLRREQPYAGIPRLRPASIAAPPLAALSNQLSAPPHTCHTGSAGRQPVVAGHSRFAQR